jgi:membrane associated rhomboid family serine protease
MQRLTRSATNVIAAIVALAGIFITAGGLSDQAAVAMGFMPARLSGVPADWTVVLTPLTATLVAGALIQLGFNLLVFVWCGAAVERVLGKTGVIALYLLGAYASALAQWAADPAYALPIVGAGGAVSAVLGAFALSFGRAKMITRSARLNRWLNAFWMGAAWAVLSMMIQFVGGQGALLAAAAGPAAAFLVGLALSRPLLLWHYRKA